MMSPDGEQRRQHQRRPAKQRADGRSTAGHTDQQQERLRPVGMRMPSHQRPPRTPSTWEITAGSTPEVSAGNPQSSPAGQPSVPAHGASTSAARHAVPGRAGQALVLVMPEPRNRARRLLGLGHARRRPQQCQRLAHPASSSTGPFSSARNRAQSGPDSVTRRASAGYCAISVSSSLPDSSDPLSM